MPQSSLPILVWKIKIIIELYNTHVAVPRDSPLPHGNLENVRLLFYEYISMLLHKYMF